MSLNMTKGESVSLTKSTPNLQQVAVGAGWDVAEGGPAMDLDLAAFLLKSGKADNGGFVYFNNKTSACGSVSSRGDNLTGEGDGDDETVDVDLTRVPADINEIVFVASIYQAAQRGQSLKSLKNAHIHIYNKADNKELAKYTISGLETGESFTLGKLVRDGSDWNFVAVGEPKSGDLSGYTQAYGLAA